MFNKQILWLKKNTTMNKNAEVIQLIMKQNHLLTFRGHLVFVIVTFLLFFK